MDGQTNGQVFLSRIQITPDVGEKGHGRVGNATGGINERTQMALVGLMWKF